MLREPIKRVCMHHSGALRWYSVGRVCLNDFMTPDRPQLLLPMVQPRGGGRRRSSRGWAAAAGGGAGGSYTHSSVDEFNRKEVSVCDETSIFEFSSVNGFRKRIKTYFDQKSQIKNSACISHI